MARRGTVEIQRIIAGIGCDGGKGDFLRGGRLRGHGRRRRRERRIEFGSEVDEVGDGNEGIVIQIAVGISCAGLPKSEPRVMKSAMVTARS
jgi:hypothetical protein